MVPYLQELNALFWRPSTQKRKSTGEADQHHASDSPPKRARHEGQPAKLKGLAINGEQPRAVKQAPPAAMQKPEEQQQEVQQQKQPKQQPDQHKPPASVTSRHQRPVNNAFKQFSDSQVSSGTPLAQPGVPQGKAMRYFAGGVPSMRQHVGSSSTPVLGWKSSSTPHAALRSQPRLMHNANSSSLYRMPQQQQQQQQPIAGEAAKWGAAAAVFGSIATPGGASPEHIKQRLSFEGPDTAARPGVPSAAAVAGRRPLHDGPGLFTRALVQAAPNMGVAVGAYAASMPAAADRGPAVYTVSPATAAGAAAAVAPPYLPLAGVVFAGLPQRQAPDITQLEQEVAEMQRQMDKCVKRHRTFRDELEHLQNSNKQALALSPGYQPNLSNPESKHALEQLLQQAAQKQQHRLEREAELLQQRSARSPAAASPAPGVHQRQQAAATAAPGAGQQRQPAAAAAAAAAAPAEESDDVICLSSDDEEEEDQQQQQQQEADEGEEDEEFDGEYVGEYEDDSESEEDEEEGSVGEAAAGIGQLQIQRDRWLGRRSDWTPSEQQLARYEETVHGPGPLEEVLTKHERACIDLTREHMGCLRRGEWLNDEVMNMYMAMLQDRDTLLRSLPGYGAPRCHFFNTFFLNKLFKDEKKYNYKNVRRWSLPARLATAGQQSSSLLDGSIDRIIVPVHEGAHWTAAMVDLVNKRILSFDSMLGRNTWVISSLKQWVRDEAQDKRKEVWDTESWPELWPEDIPRQCNGCDCGVFALLFCSRLGLGAPFDFHQDDLLLNARVKVCCELLDGRLPLPAKPH